jgi:hypothetical protein
MRNHIIAELERRRAELAALEQRRLVLSSEVNLLEDLLKHAPAESTDHPERRRRVRTAGGRAAKSRLSDRWMPVLIEAVRRYPGTVRSDEVPDIQSAAGQERAGVQNVRSHFWTNAQPGKFYERVRSGEYRATETGAQVAGLPLGGDGQHGSRNGNGADQKPAPSSFQSGDEPLSTATARFDPLTPNKAAGPGGGT